ncbi:hypothetical protein ACFL3G_07415 [Planctomycetota bacterium]
MNDLKIVLSLCLLSLFVGCNSYESATTSDYFYNNPEKDISAIGRVVLVELENDSSYPEIPAKVTKALYQSLQKKHLFGMTVLWQNEKPWRDIQVEPNATFTLEQLSAMRKRLKCNAIMTGTVTEYKPYPHMVTALRLRLIDLDDGELIWALEQIWDTTDKTTQKQIDQYYSGQHLLPNFKKTALKERLGAISSLKFIKFVAYEVGETVDAE